jgi:hypothetical protein
VAGDIDNNFDAVYAINVQDVLAVSGTPTSANKFFEGTVTITVTNGLLTVSNGAGSMNDKIDYIDITQLPPDSATRVDLSASFNRLGIVSDGSTFSGSSGLDGIGNAYSANLLGPSLAAGGHTYNFGTPGANNTVKATGQTITLPAGSFTTLAFLGAAVNGNQANQTFVVNYSDGTSDTFTQSFSDWHTPQGYAGESIASQMAYRDVTNGTSHNGPYYLYLYSFSLDPTKTVSSITLPNDGNVEILAMDLFN